MMGSAPHPVRRGPAPRLAAGLCAALGALLAAAACGGGSPAPGEAAPAAGYGGIPDLSGRPVMVLPAQAVGGGIGSPDPEIAFAVGERGGRIRWILPGDLRRAMARSPGVPVDPDHLPVEMFLRAEVQRVGDPLFGELRRLGALVGAQTALIPVETRYRTPPDGEGRIEIAAALVDIRSGRVYWFGSVEGSPGELRDPAALASAAAALVRRVSP